MKRFDIAIAGEINLDLILYGLAETMPVDRELLASDFRLTLGSSSAILAHNIAVLGLNVGFITKVGSDPLGMIALERLREANVDLSRVVHSKDGTQTGVTILLHHGATRHILTYLGTMAELTLADIDMGYLESSRHVHISSLFLQKGLQKDLPAMCRQLKGAGVSLSLDTNDDPDGQWGAPLEELLHLVDIVLPNEDEAVRMTGTRDAEHAAEALAAKGPIVAMKLGSRGSLVQRGNERWYVEPQRVEPVDTIGAGDSFNAGFLKSFLDGKALETCAAMGNVTAALSTQRPGGTEAFRDAAMRDAFLARLP
ncbi:MAG: carbohydrate kinase family protein [Acidobacteria bacterium]|nr:carbohydrate kinase family protein [Acidobacteriota bacterium]